MQAPKEWVDRLAEGIAEDVVRGLEGPLREQTELLELMRRQLETFRALAEEIVELLRAEARKEAG
jgi:signal transduction histidine kinase